MRGGRRAGMISGFAAYRPASPRNPDLVMAADERLDKTVAAALADDVLPVGRMTAGALNQCTAQIGGDALDVLSARCCGDFIGRFVKGNRALGESRRVRAHVLALGGCFPGIAHPGCGCFDGCEIAGGQTRDDRLDGFEVFTHVLFLMQR